MLSYIFANYHGILLILPSAISIVFGNTISANKILSNNIFILTENQILTEFPKDLGTSD